MVKDTHTLKKIEGKHYPAYSTVVVTLCTPTYLKNIFVLCVQVAHQGEVSPDFSWQTFQAVQIVLQVARGRHDCDPNSNSKGSTLF